MSPPKILYKYYPPARVSVLEEGEVWFSSPIDFNDTFDSLIYTKEKNTRRSLSRFRSNVGVFCLSEDPDNHLMWVHYAQQHKGLVIGFRTEDPLFSDNNRELLQVLYKAPPKKLLDASPCSDLCCYKGIEWAYEREWRCIESPVADDKRNERTVPFDPTAIAEVILGFKMEDRDRVRTLQILDGIKSAYDHTVDVSVSRALKSSRRIVHRRASFHLCEACSGIGYINAE